MNPEVRAIIRWVSASRGGRAQPPRPAIGYTTVARFESDPASAHGVWSVRIADAFELHGAEVVEAKVMFVMADAPHELLKDGERFELIEGKKVVAKGVVLPTAVQLPQQISDFDLALLG